MTSHPTEPKLPESLEAIRAALDALPPETRGTWRKLDKLPYIHVTEDPKASPWAAPCIGRFDYMDTADYIMACNPEAITELLDALKARDAEIERLRGVIVETRRVLEQENNKGDASAIRDTIWRGPAETLFDYLDAAIDQARATGGEKAND